MPISYVYRYDFLEDLRRQANDPFLRARRIRTQGETDCPHWQLAHALAKTPPETGVFRLSMWKDIQSGLACLRNATSQARESGKLIPVFQRIAAEHPFLSGFEKGVDEHLPVQAWIYVATQPISGSPDWSADGIPHLDIEVLDREGNWVPFDKAECFDTNPGSGWTTHEIPGHWSSASDLPIRFHTTQVTVPAGSFAGKWVVVHKQMGDHASSAFHLNNDEERGRLVDALALSFPFLYDTGRLLLVGEMSGAPYACEIPLVRAPATEGLLCRLGRGLTGKDPPHQRIYADVHRFDNNLALQVGALVPGGAALIQGDRRWAYSDDVIDRLK